MSLGIKFEDAITNHIQTMKHCFYILVLLLSIANPVFSQGDLEEYHLGKQRIAQGDFGQAMDMLRAYMNKSQYGEVANYASYHFARAAYGGGQYELAKNVLNQLVEETKGKWKYSEEAIYLLALCQFQQHDISQALATIAGLKNEDIKEEAYKASFDYLRNVSTSVLIVNFPNYKENEGLVMALQQHLASRTSLSSAEQEIYNEIGSMDFSDGEGRQLSRETNETLELAVVLPFNYNGGSGVRRLEDNNFIFDLYKGIKFAVDEAKTDGMDLKIRTFDTERRVDVVNKILEDPFFRVADVIMGPVYPEESQVVARFAERGKIPFINPVSNIEDEQRSTDFSYLFRPSVQTISDAILDYNHKLPGKRIAIAYSGTMRDEMLARQYAEAVSAGGFQIVANSRVSARDMRDFFDNLFTGSTRVDQVVIFSDDPNIASPTFSVVESLNITTPILVMDSWLYFNFASYEMLDTQNFYFVGNNAVEFSSPEVEKFRKGFFERYNAYPDFYSYFGYEIVKWVTNTINQNKGFDFQKNLDRNGFNEGTLTFGFNFSDSRSNKYVPILGLEDGGLRKE